jgi:trk system potassium uptake protein TrkH
MLFSTLYVVVVLIATIILTFLGVNLLEAFTGTAACMGNVGPGLGAVGSMGNFSGIPDLGVLILTLVMLVGRLEIYVLIVPFSRGFWKA